MSVSVISVVTFKNVICGVHSIEKEIINYSFQKQCPVYCQQFLIELLSAKEMYSMKTVDSWSLSKQDIVVIWVN